jgi:hypothetical protein
MAELLTYGLPLIALIAAGVLVFPWISKVVESRKKLPFKGVVKRDWLATGRIDFATNMKADAKANEQPNEFKLLVEERRIVESVAGNENLEIQWRLATLKEAKAVVTQYHKYLSENSLLKSLSDSSELSPSPTTTQDSPSDISRPASAPISQTDQVSVG